MSFADLGPQTRTIQWYPLSKVKITDAKSVSELTFAGARYELETASLPVYKERFSIASADNEVEAVLTNQVWEAMNENIQSLAGVELIREAWKYVQVLQWSGRKPLPMWHLCP